MKKNACKTAALLASLTMAALGQAQDGYLDVFVAKIKPEKRGEFEAVTKKMVDANRRNKGDNWIVSEVAYGENNTFYFSSPRMNYGQAEKASDAFMAALAKAGSIRLLQDFNNCVASTRSELRRRRNDLSANPPGDASAVLKLVGESRWIRTAMVRVRPGHLPEYEEQLRASRAASQRTGRTLLVSQSVAGTNGAVFYISTLAKSLSDFDSLPGLRQSLGEEGYRRYNEVAARAVLTTEIIIARYAPELSNAPEAVVAVDPGFWKPKPPAAAKPKPGEAKKQ